MTKNLPILQMEVAVLILNFTAILRALETKSYLYSGEKALMEIFALKILTKGLGNI